MSLQPNHWAKARARYVANESLLRTIFFLEPSGAAGLRGYGPRRDVHTVAARCNVVLVSRGEATFGVFGAGGVRNLQRQTARPVQSTQSTPLNTQSTHSQLTVNSALFIGFHTSFALLE